MPFSAVSVASVAAPLSSAADGAAAFFAEDMVPLLAGLVADPAVSGAAAVLLLAPDLASVGAAALSPLDSWAGAASEVEPVSVLLPAAGAPAAEIDGARRELVERLKVSIRDDAKTRADAGEIKPATAPPTCVRTPGTPTSGDYGVLDCFVQTSPVSQSKSKLLSGLGYPFRAVVHYDTFTYAWCMTEPVPSDNLIKGEDARATQLPAPCQSKQ
jgi:hypothetical protein